MKKCLCSLFVIVMLLAFSSCEEADSGVPYNAAISESVSKVDIAKFIDLGCVKTTSPEMDCSSAGLEDKYRCSKITEPPEVLGDLTPAYPVVVCALTCLTSSSEWCESASTDMNFGVYSYSGLMQTYYRYIYINEDGATAVIKNADEFKTIFQPVSSGKEAVAFAAGLTRYGVQSDTNLPEGCTKILAPVTITEGVSLAIPVGAYQVNLYGFIVPGCYETHVYKRHEFTVTTDGNVKYSSSTAICNNPELAGMCVD